MRRLAVSIAAAILSVSTAIAGPLAPPPEDSGLEFGGLFQNPVPLPLEAGDVIEISNIIPNEIEGSIPLTAAGSFEFGGVEVAPMPSMTFKIAVGADNNGVEFVMNYDRSRVSDPAFVAGAETGVLVGTITSTVVAEVFEIVTGSFTQYFVLLAGELIFDDGAGVYDDGIVGSWSLSSIFAANDDPIAVSLAIGTGNSAIPTDVSEPAIVALMGLGLFGLGVAARRRA